MPSHLAKMISGPEKRRSSSCFLKRCNNTESFYLLLVDLHGASSNGEFLVEMCLIQLKPSLDEPDWVRHCGGDDRRRKSASYVYHWRVLHVSWQLGIYLRLQRFVSEEKYASEITKKNPTDIMLKS